MKNQLPEGTEVRPHQWFGFSDLNGKGCAQSDVYVVLTDKVLLFECKLTEGPHGVQQLERLYAPLLERIYRRPVVRCQVVKNLRRAAGRRFELHSIEEALTADDTHTYTWHWLP